MSTILATENFQAGRDVVLATSKILLDNSNRELQNAPVILNFANKIKEIANLNKRKKDCLWKQRTHYRLENGSLGFIETLHKQ